MASVLSAFEAPSALSAFEAPNALSGFEAPNALSGFEATSVETTLVVTVGGEYSWTKDG